MGDRVRSIAIGGRDDLGRQRYATPLDLEAEPAAPGEPLELWVDWVGLANHAGLSDREKAVFLAGGWPVNSESAPTLGLSPQQSGALNRGIAKKLLACREQLGNFVAKLTPTERKVQESWSTSQKRESLTNLCERGRMTKPPGLERRLLGSIRTSARTIRGTIPYGTPFQKTPNSPAEVLNVGCFANWLRAGNDIIAAAHCDLSMILGRRSADTAQVWDGGDGLEIVIPVETRLSYVADLLESIRRGDISQMGLEYGVIRSQWIRVLGEPVLSIDEACLFIVGPSGQGIGHIARDQTEQITAAELEGYRRGFAAALKHTAEGTLLMNIGSSRVQ